MESIRTFCRFLIGLPRLIKKEGIDPLKPLPNPPHIQARIDKWRGSPRVSVWEAVREANRVYRETWVTGKLVFPSTRFTSEGYEEKRRQEERDMARLREEIELSKRAALGGEGGEGKREDLVGSAKGYVLGKVEALQGALREFTEGYKDGRVDGRNKYSVGEETNK
eukprot:Nk52_evm20s273 gene=Nk52_evmTU20s273